MNVLLITQINGNILCAVVEHPDGVEQDEVVRHWVAMQGLPPEAISKFKVNYCPVTAWGSISHAFEPCSV